MIILSNDIFISVREELDQLEDRLLEAVKTPLPLITDVGTHLAGSGGKRLRPALCFLAAHCSDKYKCSHIMPLAVAVEMVHMASLIHDDVIDEADLRRGRPTVNSVWGNRVAILSGDYMFAQAFQVVYDEHYGEAVALKMAQLIGALTSGEIIQDAAAFSGSCTEQEYYERIEKKTAGFLGICCELGAMASGTDKAVSDALYKYGRNLGMAFQITDDVLDVTGTRRVIGKPAGNDIRQGVLTLPVIRAMEVSSDRDELKRIVTDEAMTEEMVARALDIVRASDGIEASRQKAEAYLKAAMAAIKGIVPETMLSGFRRVVDFVGSRDY